MFLPQETIRIKRDGGRLNDDQIAEFIAGLTDGRVTDGQAAAFAMAVFLRGMEEGERVALLRAMTRSGRVLDWGNARLGGPVLDKHSTGGVGDKVSLVLAPVVAACGGFVPMISGRGLGHTGGTLDKMQAIPGYEALPDIATLRRVVGNVGCAIVGATTDIAPADKRLYAIRDVTATVESIDLIVASILSKKLAAGLQGLVLDVKLGNGAFMDSAERAEALATALVETGNGAGLPTVALLTGMDQVLGRTAGNAVEVAESVEMLRDGTGDSRLWAVTRELAAEMLVLGRLADSLDAARIKADRALRSGEAAERFQRMVTALGGPSDFVDRYQDHLPKAPVVREVRAERPGFVTAHATRDIGLVVVALGGGRTKPTEPVDHAVGLTEVAALGTEVGPQGAPLCILHAPDEEAADMAAAAIRAAMPVGDSRPADQNPIAGRIAKG
ncbi:thymidine phosphorylase [Indioceanicola profundi]|uniref:thymidine phosphorylase n=1 Tax=Indioceanicola profundi TaxID=2220096 RepID=UPI000E6A9EAA|nr:thymidine phosphorylase [Indioceanicola profundi]